MLVNVVCSEILSEIRRRQRCKHNGYTQCICCSENTCFPDTWLRTKWRKLGWCFREQPERRSLKRQVRMGRR